MSPTSFAIEAVIWSIRPTRSDASFAPICAIAATNSAMLPMTAA
jgi:hypothetical protein